MTPDECGIITQNQIKSKVEELLGVEESRSRALILKELAKKSINKGGSSFENLNIFVDAIRECNPA